MTVNHEQFKLNMDDSLIEMIGLGSNALKLCFLQLKSCFFTISGFSFSDNIIYLRTLNSIFYDAEFYTIRILFPLSSPPPSAYSIVISILFIRSISISILFIRIIVISILFIRIIVIYVLFIRSCSVAFSCKIAVRNKDLLAHISLHYHTLIRIERTKNFDHLSLLVQISAMSASLQCYCYCC